MATHDVLASVTDALRDMAFFRGAEVSDETLLRFAVELLRTCDADDLCAAVMQFGREERREGETAWPSLGTLLRLTSEKRAIRMHERQRQARVVISLVEQVQMHGLDPVVAAKILRDQNIDVDDFIDAVPNREARALVQPGALRLVE